MNSMVQEDSYAPLPRLAPRSAESHKGDYGRALLIGGSRGMAGAIAMAGMATLRSGAGLVRLAVGRTILDQVAGFEPSYMTFPLDDDDQGRILSAGSSPLHEQIESSDVVACGPGMGRGFGPTELVAALYESLAQPALFDADALFALAKRPRLLVPQPGPRILTPHPGEFARLTRSPAGGDRAAMETRATRLAADAGCILVLKGHRTLITDGQQSFRNTTGNPGMATGGSGDILTGVVTGLLAQGMTPLDAARLGVHVHGLAGDLATAELGQVSLIASDLLRFLPRAFLQLEQR
jgi:NAD(P)H-hydrate epimerase